MRREHRHRRGDQHARAVPGAAGAPGEAAGGDPGADGDDACGAAPRASFRWVYTLFPTSAYASDAEMSLAEFEDFYFGACFADSDDPVEAWRTASEEWKRLADWIEGHEEVHVTAPGTDITLGIGGRKFIAADGEHNMPDGEFFTAPVEDSVEGEVSFHLPAMVGGREVVGAHLRFELRQGRRRECRAWGGLPGEPARHRRGLAPARRARESARTSASTAGLATCCSTRRSAAPSTWRSGRAIPSAAGRNESAVHTDLVCDLRRGGRIEVDGEPFQEDGRFVA